MALQKHHTLLLIVLASLVISTAMGLRHGFGLFLEPMSSDFGWGRGVFAFALAVQNLIWGLSQPFTGALADRFGAVRFAGSMGDKTGTRAYADVTCARRETWPEVFATPLRRRWARRSGRWRCWKSLTWDSMTLASPTA